MIRSPVTPRWVEAQADAERVSQEREQRDAEAERFVPPPLEAARPDIPAGYARRLRNFAWAVEGLLEAYDLKHGQCAELDKLVARFAIVTKPIIAEAMNLARSEEQKAQQLAGEME